MNELFNESAKSFFKRGNRAEGRKPKRLLHHALRTPLLKNQTLALIYLFCFLLNTFLNRLQADPTSEINNAINNLNISGSGTSSSITVSGQVTLSGALTQQTSGNLTVNGNGNTISGNAYSGFFVQGGTLTITNASLNNFTALGGSGSGGGAGLGGAVFVNNGASLTLSNVSFTNDAAVGGTGGTGASNGGNLNSLSGDGPGIAPGTPGLTTQSNQTDNLNTASYISTLENNESQLQGNNSTATQLMNQLNQEDDNSNVTITSTTDSSGNVSSSGNDPGDTSLTSSQINDDLQETSDLAAQVNSIVNGSTETLYEENGNGTSGYNGTAGGNGTIGQGAQGGSGGDGVGGNGLNVDIIVGETTAALNLTAAILSTVGSIITYPDVFSLPLAVVITANGVVQISAAAVTLGIDANDLVVEQELGTTGIGGNGGAGASGGSGSFGYGGGGGGNGGDGGAAANDSTYWSGNSNAPGANYSDGMVNGTANGAISGNGGSGGSGGNGGFGAGGGAGGTGGQAGGAYTDYLKGVNGANGAGGQGGFGAGNGAGSNGGGGGGSGYGGAIFVNAGGTLKISGNSTFSADQVEAGISEDGGAAGNAAGSDLFLKAGSNSGNVLGAVANFDPGVGNTITFYGTISDDSANVSTMYKTQIEIGPGLVIYDGANTYTGHTILESGGVLQAIDGVTMSSQSSLTFNGGVFQSSGVFSRSLGTGSGQAQFTSSGGFAAVNGSLTVSLNGDQALLWGAGSFIPIYSALLFGSSTATDNVNFINSIDFHNGTGTVLVTDSTTNPGKDTATLSGVLSDGALSVNDATHTGTLILTNTETYTGGTTINNGSLFLEGSNASLASTGSVTNNGNFDISQSKNQTIGDLQGTNSAATVNLGQYTLTTGGDNSTTSYAGKINGTGGLTKQGTGIFTLSNAQGYTGTTDIEDGTLALTGTAALSSSGSVVNNATFDLSQISNSALNAVIIGDLSGTNANAEVYLGSSMLMTGGDNNSTSYAGSIHDAGGINSTATEGVLVKVGTGTLTLLGASDYTGGTYIEAGTLALKGGLASLWNSGAVVDNGNLDLSQTGNQTIGTLTGIISGGVTPTVKLGGNTLTVGNDNGSGSFSGVISDGGISGGTGGGLTKVGTGMQVLTGANTYTGTTDIEDGTLALSGSGASLYSHGSVINNADFDISTSQDQTIGDLKGTSTSATVNLGAYTLSTGGDNATTEYDGTINGSGGLHKQGTGTFTLTNTNGYTGATTIDAGGTLALSGANASLASTTAVTANGTFDISQAGTNQTIGDLSGGKNGSVNLGANTLTFGTSDNTEFDGSITGTGGLIKDGSGLVYLTGSSNYSGGTILNGGTIEIGSNDALGTGEVTVAAVSTLTTNGGNYDLANKINLLPALTENIMSGTTTQSNTLSGSNTDNLIKTGAGTLALTGHNTYTGDTDLGDGTNVAGTLAVGTNDALGNTTNVAGDGSTLKVFTNSHATLTTVGASGTTITLYNNIQLNNSDVASNLQIVDGGSVPLLNLQGNISGIGGLVVEGPGKLILGGNNSYFGTTVVNGGTLEVTSSTGLGNSTLTITDGTTVTYGPGLTTVVIGGNFNAASGATTNLSVFESGKLLPNAENAGTAGTDYQTMVVGGAANVTGGKILLDFLNPGTGQPSQGQRYTLLTAAGGITGQLDTSNGLTNATSINPLFRVAIAYDDDNNNSITLTLLLPFSQSFGPLTPNQTAVANNIDKYDTVYTTGDFADNLVANLNQTTYGAPGALAHALDELSPQRYQLLSQMAFDNFTFTNQQLEDHLTNWRDGASGMDTSGLTIYNSSIDQGLMNVSGRLLAWNPPPEGGNGSTDQVLSDVPNSIMTSASVAPDNWQDNRWSSFITGGVVLANKQDSPDVAQSSYTEGGVTIGTDYRLTEHTAVGVLFNYDHTAATLDNEGSHANIDIYQPGVYATYANNGWYLDGLAACAYNKDATQRNIEFASLDRAAQASPSGYQFSGAITGGYEFHLGSLTMGPSAGLAAVHMDTNSFTETGADSADLQVQDMSANSVRSRLGFTSRYLFKVGSAGITPHVNVYWQHEFVNNDTISSSFAEPGIGSFSVQTTAPSKNTALIDVGLDSEVVKNLDLLLDYQGQGMPKDLANEVELGVKYVY